MNSSGPPSLAQVVSALGLRAPTKEQAAIATLAPFTESGGARLSQPLLVVAGAGSGKTETLALRATYLAAHYGIPGHSILGLTFTRKAAAELSERLRSRLQGWANFKDSDEPAENRVAGASRGAPINPVGTYEHVPEATTYNSFALSVVQEFGSQIGLGSGVVHLGEAAAWQQMSEIVAEWNGDLGSSLAEGSVVDRVLSLRDAIANQAMTTQEARRRIGELLARFEAADAQGTRSYVKSFHRVGESTLRQQLEMLAIIEEFDRRKAEAGTMDYADQVLAAIKVVEESPEARQALRRRHRVVFLDEFQDTSVAQMRFLSALFADHPVTAVGDPNQAIYGWRGASAASLQEFHHRFSREDSRGVTLTLSTAWRNDRSILRAANVLAAPLSRTPPYLSGANASAPVALPELSARPAAPAGSVHAVFTATQSEAIAETVRFVKEKREALTCVRGSESRPGSVAVLARTRAMLSPVVAALKSAGIPAQVVGGDALLAHPVVRDLRATLEITCDVGGSDHLLRLLSDLDLGAGDLRALGSHARLLAARRRAAHAGRETTGPREPALLLDAVQSCAQGETVRWLSEAGARRVGQLGRRLATLRTRIGLPISEQVQDARFIMGLDAEAAADPTAEDVTSVLDVFADTASEYEATAERPTMEAFLQWLDAAELRERGLSAPQVDLDPDAVQVMTIHASKGLEWDAVALVDVASSRFPLGGRGLRTSGGQTFPPPNPAPANGWLNDPGSLAFPLREDRHQLPDPNIWDMDQSGSALRQQFREDVGAYLQDEERRLAYVATTRARHCLMLAGSWFASAKSPRFPSVFMAELFAADRPESNWTDFLDGQQHSIGGPRAGRLEDDSEGSDSPAVSSGWISSLPEEDAWPRLADPGTDALYPREPGAVRRQIEQGAARVREERAAILHPEADLPQVLATLEDESLVRDVQALLADRKRRADSNAPAVSPTDVLGRVAQSRPLSVTELAAFNANPEAVARDMLRPVPTPPGESTQVGTAFHAWMEARLRRLSVEGADPDQDSEKTPHFPLTAGDRALFDRLVASAADLDLSGYLVAAVEVPFSVTEGGQIVRGRIDAVLQPSSASSGVPGDYLLIDWKTTRGKRRNLRRSDAVRYMTQLEYYRRAWEPIAAKQGVEVRAQLVFVSPEDVWVVTEEELSAL